ncbi:M14 family metallopeptidase [Streptomyces xanthochromogenes]|uniref:Zinc carboxypeptidase n=1 Tax=Streptomyces xanthochromogenes TaxID=67384 RepID=A0ABQ3ABW8_9ACTN|nr:M14 family metallopeptidase [Streptomyces xanthochromogenes]GGY45206.1 zinc carboxypeptidase [Streptomyces xanthochromogenes]
MRRRARAILAAASLLTAGLVAAPVAQASQSGADGEGIVVWNAQVSRAQLPLLLEAGADAQELGAELPAKGSAGVELYLTKSQAAALRGKGVTLSERKVSAQSQNRLKAAGDGVFRPYSGTNGLKQEILDTGRANPGLTKVESIGRTTNGQDILALKLTKGANKSKDGSKPATLYMSNQHAREWITPEMTRRLMHYYLDNYGKDPRITKIVDSTELWFVLSANPDGYDYTFTPGNRLWRKNLRDNNGDGKITSVDGVDPNRNFPYKWGYDNEGSSDDPSNETYRGPSAGSEPETRALDSFEKRVHFNYAINYHSAAELLLYGVGWQVATPTPDDVIYKSLAGTPDKPAIPGYLSEVSSALYTTNGEADGHAANVNGTMMFTPEMSTCTTASNVDPGDEWNAADCPSDFNFPDSEKLIQGEFQKNIPFALSVAETSAHPDQPSSSVGIAAPDFTPDTFATSYARDDDQQVAVTVRKSVRDKTLNYRINNGRTQTEELKPWKGGEVYGGQDNIRFDQYRAKVEDAHAGDRVQVWFTGRTAAGARTSSTPFTYTVAQRPRGDTLVLADEGGTGAAKNAALYTKALADNGRKAAVWDVATQGTPSALGVLSHFRNVVWYTGSAQPKAATMFAVRDFVNEGGKLVNAGEQAGGSVDLGGGALSDDFSQYYLGAYNKAGLKSPPAFAGAGKLAGAKASLAAGPGSPLTAAGAYTITSDTLKPQQFPQFTSASAGDYPGIRTPFEPAAGSWFAAAQHRDDAYMRLARTVDLSQTTAADRPSLDFQLSYDTEPGYDQVIVEAHTVGQDDWTTLPDTNGGSTTSVPSQCEQGYLLQEHPFLTHYLTLGSPACTATGSSGTWNRFTGSSDGWQQVSLDLAAYAGKQVEIAVSYVSDPGTGGLGAFVDDTRLVVGGTASGAEGFETSLGPWSVPGAPAGSPGNSGDWARSQALFHSSAAVATRDTVLLGFGLENVPSAADRKQVLGKALSALHR